jgi:hypothetical protein
MLGFGALGEFALGEGPPRDFDITGIMSALETPDTFLAAADAWNRVAGAEIGVIANRSPVAEIGIAIPPLSPGSGFRRS